MNLEDEPDYVKALADVDHRVIDGKLFIAANDLDILTNTIIAAMMQYKHCPHSFAVADVILSNYSAFTDTLNALNASEMVPDTVPDDIMGE